MSTKPTVLILGATGQTGESILKGIVQTNAFNVEALVRHSSSTKPEVEALRQQGIPIRLADTSGPLPDLIDALKGVDIFISAIGATGLLDQLKVVDAVKAAGVKRFIPCGFIIVTPVGNVMGMRDEKEEVYNYIKKQRVPYTVVDTGYWSQLSVPRVPSGRLDGVLLIPANEVYAGGDAENIITDLWDIGTLVAEIIRDERTLNKYVVTCGEVLSQNEITKIVEEVSGEKVELTAVSHSGFDYSNGITSPTYCTLQVSAEQLLHRLSEARASIAAGSTEWSTKAKMVVLEYSHSKYVRGDNSPAYAKYLGYLDTRDLYPGVKTRSFREFVKDALDGKEGKMYRHKNWNFSSD